MTDFVRFYGPALLAWGFVVGKLLRWRRRGSTASLTLWTVLISLAVSFTVSAPWPYHAIAEVTGVPNIGRLLSHILMIVAAWGTLVMMLKLGKTPGRRHLWWPALTIVALSVVFSLADTPVDDPRFAGRYGGIPWVLEYWLVFMAGLVPAFVTITRLCWRYAELSGTFIGKLGLRLISAGVAVSLVYHVHKAIYLAGERFGFPNPGFGAFVDIILPPTASVMVLLGATVPAWGLTTLVDWTGRWLTFHRLRPLWYALYRASPHIALVPPRPLLVEFLQAREDLDLMLYRRVIEIRDGRLALQQYLEAPSTTDAVGEATALAAAVTAKLSGAPPRRTEPVAVTGGRDLESDTAFLNDVACAFRKLRLNPARAVSA